MPSAIPAIKQVIDHRLTDSTFPEPVVIGIKPGNSISPIDGFYIKADLVIALSGIRKTDLIDRNEISRLHWLLGRHLRLHQLFQAVIPPTKIIATDIKDIPGRLFLWPVRHRRWSCHFAEIKNPFRRMVYVVNHHPVNQHKLFRIPLRIFLFKGTGILLQKLISLFNRKEAEMYQQYLILRPQVPIFPCVIPDLFRADYTVDIKRHPYHSFLSVRLREHRKHIIRAAAGAL